MFLPCQIIIAKFLSNAGDSDITTSNSPHENDDCPRLQKIVAECFQS